MTAIALRKTEKESVRLVKHTASSVHAEKQIRESKKSVVCRSCSHIITRQNLAIDPAGKIFKNPVGIEFHIVCYKDAPGTNDIGTPTTEFSWFPDYAWSFAHCTKCHVHLGWWFSGPTRFIGLITERIKLTG